MGDLSGFFTRARPLETAVFVALIEKAEAVSFIMDCLDPVRTFPAEKEQGVAVRECIPVYHKLALSRIHKGEPVVKYGEWIGIAACDIEQGMHVHVHNVWNTKR